MSEISGVLASIATAHGVFTLLSTICAYYLGDLRGYWDGYEAGYRAGLAKTKEGSKKGGNRASEEHNQDS